MYKNSDITNFFKPFATLNRNKRPLSEDTIDEHRHRQHARSTTPGTAHNVKTPLRSIDPHGQKSVPNESLGVNSASVNKLKYDATDDMASENQQILHEIRTESGGPQSHVFAGSQRVVRDGRVVIRNSDDESESDMSLDDIDDLLVARKHTVVSSPPTDSDLSHPRSIEQEEIAKTSKKARKKGSCPADDAYLSSALPVLPKYKFSLKALEAKAKQERAAEVGTSKAKSLLETFEQEKTMFINKDRRVATAGGKHDADLVAAVMKDKGDEEGIGRLMTAIERTEAFHQGKTWLFFSTVNDPTLLEQADFPVLDDVYWHGVLADSTSRQQAFLGGFVGDIASKKELPDELLLWILDAACLEPRDDLRNSYAYTFTEAQDQLSSLLTPSRIDMLFRRIGASIEALNIQKSILPLQCLNQNEKYMDWSRLLSVLELINQISPYMNIESQMHMICLLCRMLLDSSVVKDGAAVTAIDRALTSLVDSVLQKNPENEFSYVLNTVYPSVTDTTLRLQLLKYIPASLPQLNLIRRRLALSFFFEDASFLSKPTKSLLDLRSVAHHLQGPQFAIRNDTDYSDLAASIAILSIAVDDGDQTQAGTDKQEGIAFNQDIDMLSRRIYTMFTSIVDTGASHMKRTEAKEVIEGFHSRLQYAVRTKRKQKSMLFGNSMLDADLDSMKNGLQSFLQR